MCITIIVVKNRVALECSTVILVPFLYKTSKSLLNKARYHDVRRQISGSFSSGRLYCKGYQRECFIVPTNRTVSQLNCFTPSVLSHRIELCSRDHSARISFFVNFVMVALLPASVSVFTELPLHQINLFTVFFLQGVPVGNVFCPDGHSIGGMPYLASLHPYNIIIMFCCCVVVCYQTSTRSAFYGSYETSTWTTTTWGGTSPRTWAHTSPRSSWRATWTTNVQSRSL